MNFTHINQNNQPNMVDISSKENTTRIANAYGEINLPAELMTLINGKEILTKKGPIIQTAIIAGTMAVKKTHELIPFCHSLQLEKIDFDIEINTEFQKIEVFCTVKSYGKTGVEMEALTGVQIALLTIYDMCKAITQKMVMGEIKLISKTGGKSDYLLSKLPIYGLILAGGKSKRMGEDKSKLQFYNKAHAHYLADLIKPLCDEVFYSTRLNQEGIEHLQGYYHITDEEDLGSLSGIYSAMKLYPKARWLVIACDMPFISSTAVKELIEKSNPKQDATCFTNEEMNWPEPLFTIYEPSIFNQITKNIENNILCPRKLLEMSHILKLSPIDTNIITNCNFPNEKNQAINIIEERHE